MKKQPITDIQHPTSKALGMPSGRIGCSVLEVECRMFSGRRFTPCTERISLLETVTDAAEIAAKLAKILLSTAGSSFDELQNARKCGQRLCRAVESISWGSSRSHPNISGERAAHLDQATMNVGKCNFSFRGFLREKHDTNNLITQTSLEKGRQPRQTNE